MEKISSKTLELFNKINELSGNEFTNQLAFVTYFLKANPYKSDLEDAKIYWFDNDNFIYEYSRTLEMLLNYSKSINPILQDLISDALDIMTFYLDGRLREIAEAPTLIKQFVKEATVDELKAILLRSINANIDSFADSSPSVAKLSAQLLCLEEDDSILDLCSGKGEFLSLISSGDKLTGVEINYDVLKKSFVYCLLNDKKPEFLHQDALTFAGRTYNKIFCEYPFGLIYDRPFQFLGCEKWKPLPVTDLKRSMTSWIFISKVLSLLDKNGIAVVRCNDGALFSTYENDIRKMAISMGLVKGVISLPSKIYVGTNVKTSLLVLSYGNESIRFVDATSFGVINSRSKCVSFTDDDIKEIVKLFNSSEKYDLALTVNNEDFDESNLTVNRYLRPKISRIEIKDGKKLSDILDRLVKSAVFNSAFLTNNPASGIKVLSSSDIKDGIADARNLPYLSLEGMEYLPKNWKNSFLENGDVIMTNKSTVIKSAVVNIEDENVLLFGSLYAMRLKKDVLLPPYLCGFINSNVGQMLLKTIQTGTVISMITAGNLLEFIVPCPSMTKQIKLVEQMSITLDMIRESRERIIKLQNSYERSFDDLILEEE